MVDFIPLIILFVEQITLILLFLILGYFSWNLDFSSNNGAFEPIIIELDRLVIVFRDITQSRK
ncbi:MAG: hypothetical protein K9W44_13945 [Candidatus Lokiarchaeota archaeon]|nr:hypothetical protein [Candidatus Harpocratesius repetitus]